MPFWSKKGKERASTQEDVEGPDRKYTHVQDSNGEWTRHLGYRLPKEEAKAYSARWEEECNRRREVASQITDGPRTCSPRILAADEAIIEALLMYCESETGNWTKEEVQQYTPESYATTAYVRRQLDQDFGRMHADCCQLKGGKDERIGWAVRNLRKWDGKQPLEDMKIDISAPTQSADTNELPPPTYTEAAAPAYADTFQVGPEKERQEK